MTKRSWRTLFTGCYGSSGGSDHLVSNKVVSQKGSIPRLSSSESGSLSLEDISVSLAGSNLYLFTLEELQMATGGFCSSNFVGEGGFGPVYKGFVDGRVRPGMEAQAVAVKLLDLAGSQGDREWLVRSQLEFILHPLSLPWLTRLKIAVGAAKGLAFLHDTERPVIYRDFKASNILLDSVILLFFACTSCISFLGEINRVQVSPDIRKPKPHWCDFRKSHGVPSYFGEGRASILSTIQ